MTNRRSDRAGESWRTSSLWDRLGIGAVAEAIGRGSLSGELIFVIYDDHGKLAALLDEHRHEVNQQALAKKKQSREQITLAEKLAIDRQHKPELDELNRWIKELKRARWSRPCDTPS